MVRIIFTLLLAILEAGIPVISGSRILLVPGQFHSHISEQFVVGHQLVSMGHEVYIVLEDRINMHDEAKSKGIKVLMFHIPARMKTFSVLADMAQQMVFSGFDVSEFLGRGSQMYRSICKCMMEDDTLRQQIQELQFGIAISDSLFLSYCQLLLPASLNIPFIAMSSILMPTWAGIPALPSFVPDTFSSYTDNMTFLERLSNTFPFVMLSNIRTIPFLGNISGITDTSLLKRYAPNYTDPIQLYSKAEFYIVTKDHNLESPVPSMPYTLYLPGITMAPSKPLNDEMNQIATQAKSGIIIVSFGSSSFTLPSDIISKFLNAFKDLPQTIIWKYRDFPHDLKPLAPSNVRIMDWLPQNHLLGHPNTKLFITHCGNNDQYEALYHGVPMIGFPLFAEQHHNAHRMETKGVGLTMDIKNFDAVTLKANIQGILGNQQMKTRVDKFSKILKSRPMLPREEAAYWVDHIIKFGSDHLKSSAKEMPMYQLYLLDVLLFVGCLVLLAVFSMFILVVCSIKRCLKMLSNSERKVKQN